MSMSFKVPRQRGDHSTNGCERCRDRPATVLALGEAEFRVWCCSDCWPLLKRLCVEDGLPISGWALID